MCVVTNKGFITSVVFEIQGGTSSVPFLYAVSSLALVRRGRVMTVVNAFDEVFAVKIVNTKIQVKV